MAARRTLSTAGLAIATFVASALAARAGLAEGIRPPVVVEIEACEQPLAAEVRRIVGVELRATVIETAIAGEAVTRVVATCHDAEVQLSLADAITGRHLKRSVALSQAAPSARARLFALAVAELVVASWQEIENGGGATKRGSSPMPQPVVPPPTLSPTAVPTKPVSAMGEAVGVLRIFPGSDLWLLGAGARGILKLVRPLTLALELTAEWGNASRTTGQVGVRTLGGGLGLGWGIERNWVFILPWVGARGGVARLTGEPSPSAGTSGGTQSGSWLGPELGVATTLFPHAAVHPTVALSAGVMLLGVRGDVIGDDNVSVTGPWGALLVGVGFTKP